jgi:dTMP kinase
MNAQTPMPGRLIAVEGLDGSGKSTQIKLLHTWLEGLGCRVFFTEWNSSELVKGATKKGKRRQALTPTTFSLIHATDFADRYERQIHPMLQAGYIVLCDRYIFTSFARDAVRGCDPKWVKSLYGFARVPDIQFYFRLDLDIALGRILEGRPELKYFEAGMDLGLSSDPVESFRLFQARVMAQYDRMSKEYAFTEVDAGDDGIFERQAEVRRIVAEKIDLSMFRKGGL